MALTVTTTTLTSLGSGKYRIASPRWNDNSDILITSYTKGNETSLLINVIKVYRDGTEAYVGQLLALNEAGKWGILMSATRAYKTVWNLTNLYNCEYIKLELITTGATATGTVLLDVIRNKKN